MTLPPPDFHIRYSFAFSLLQLVGPFGVGTLRAKQAGAETVVVVVVVVVVVALFVVAVCIATCSHLIRRFVPESK
jgi:hypothetical protein